MATIGSLAVNVVANTEPLTRGMKKARGQVKGFTKTTDKASFSMKKFAAALGLFAAASKGLQLVKSQFTAIDALAKTADKLGITTENLAGYQHAAKLAGIETNTFNTALQRMVRRLAEVDQTGKGVALKALDAMGLSIRDLAGLSPDRQLAMIADGFQNLETQGEKVLQAFALFDTEGVAMVNLLAQGSAGLAAMTKEAKNLGLAISRDAAAQIEKANDAMTRLDASMAGLGRTMAVEFAEPLTKVTDTLTVAVQQFKFFDDGIKAIDLTVTRLSRSLWGMVSALDESANAVKRAIPGTGFNTAAGEAESTKVFNRLDSRVKRMEADIFAEQFGGLLTDTFTELGKSGPAKAAAKVQRGGMFDVGRLFGRSSREEEAKKESAKKSGLFNSANLIGEAIAKAQNKAQLIGINAKLQSGLAGKSIGNIILDDILKLNKKGEEEEKPRKVIQGELQALERGTAAAFSATRKQPIQDVAKNTKASVDLQKTANKTLTDIASNLLLVPANLGA